MIVTLKGSALKAEAARLAIPGRSAMTADELRAAIGIVLDTLATPTTPATNGATVPPQRSTVPTPTAPVPTPAVFAARWGKRKPSLNGRLRRRSL